MDESGIDPPVFPFRTMAWDSSSIFHPENATPTGAKETADQWPQYQRAQHPAARYSCAGAIPENAILASHFTG